MGVVPSSFSTNVIVVVFTEIFIKSEKLYVYLQYEISIKVLIVYNLKNLNVKSYPYCL